MMHTRLVFILFLLVSVIPLCSSSNDFAYTACHWQDSKCELFDRKDLIEGDLKTTRWPRGTYALLTPREGCPESPDRGWTRGNIAFTWKQPHVFVSSKGYELNSSQADFNTDYHERLIPELWPDIQSNMLGPFSKYALRLNFCFKTDNVDNGSEGVWPKGLYSIFGDNSGCPSGFESSDLTIHLPPIFSWKSNGKLPGHKVISNDKDDSVDLVFKSCIRIGQQENLNSTDDDDTINSTGSMYDREDSFVLIKTNASHCPQIANMYVTIEHLKLLEDEADENAYIEIFTICHYQPSEWTEEIEKYFYFPQDFERRRNAKSFIVGDTTFLFGNTTLTKETKQKGFSYFIPTRNPVYWPWLLIDLGRNMIVTGLQFTDLFLRTASGDYMGTLNTTLSGLACKRWDDQDLSAMVYDEMFPERSRVDAQNFCRSVGETGTIYCYPDNTGTSMELCAWLVFKFPLEKRPFMRCFIGDDRWTMDDFGAELCLFSVSYYYSNLIYTFRKQYDGRYIKLAGYPDYSNYFFNTMTTNLQVLTSAKITHDDTICNEDLGMADGRLNIPDIMYEYSRPFSYGWCPEPDVKNPHVAVELPEEMRIEGITVFNMQHIQDEVMNGIFHRRVLLRGSSELLVSLSTTTQNRTHAKRNMTFRLDEYLPIDRPQTFFFEEPVKVNYVDIFIIDSSEEKCLRFELHGCRGSGYDTTSLPALTNMNGEVTLNNLQTVTLTSNFTSVHPSIVYQGTIPSGSSFMWLINVPAGHYIRLLFMSVTYNVYQHEGYCSDSLKFLPGGQKGRHILEGFWEQRALALINTEESNIALMISICTPMSKIQLVNKGFKAIVSTSAIPTCFSTETRSKDSLQSVCMKPQMYLSSLSRLTDHILTDPEEWTIHINRASIRMQFIYFNIRCDTGSSLEIKDRFAETKSYCNLHRVQQEMLFDSEKVHLRFNKGDVARSREVRLSATEWFKAKYTAVESSMAYLIDSEKHELPTTKKLLELEVQWDPVWTNSSIMLYKACSLRFGKCYFLYSGAPSTWKDAGSECWITGTRLVTIHSDVEQEFIKYMLRNFRFFDFGTLQIPETSFKSDTVDPNYYTHIGLSRVTTETGKHVHVWEDGSPVTFSAWYHNEPSALGDCTRMSFHLLNTNNTWETESCETGLTSFFVCEREVTDELLGIKESETQFYDGTLNITLSGIPCQRWDSQYPHSDDWTWNNPDAFVDGNPTKAENYCRDPQNNGFIWCYTTDPDIRWERCRIEETTGILPRHYLGKLSTTKSGRTCQRWDRQTPHTHGNVNPTSYPDKSIKDASNYCRDPDITGMLWCYTTDPKSRWEVCNFIDTASDRCYSTHFQYTGQWNQTKSGKTCQQWISQEPHDHELFEDSQFPEGTVEDASNYCRDPYNEGYLWCFTTDPALRSEQCVFNYTYDDLDTRVQFSVNNETFQCGNDDYIAINNVCDGVPNCVDSSDEKNCVDKVHPLLQNVTFSMETPSMTRLHSMVQCGSFEWISLHSQCDGVIDCADAFDEINCSITTTLTNGISDLSVSEYICDSGESIHISQMCDFIADCTDASDEICDYPLCSNREFRCQNQQCIPIENRCDAYENCLDGSDEVDCDVCRNNTFYCDQRRCLPRRLVCDKYPDCLDETDELSCNPPIRQSCEEWWNAGYRTTGVYKININEVECNFDSIPVNGIIKTVFYSFEVTRSISVEVIHSTVKQSGKGYETSFFKNSSYSCEQNIKQTCTEAYRAALESRDSSYGDVFKHCNNCLTMKVNLSRFEGNYSEAYHCDGDEALADPMSLLFTYRQSENYTRNVTVLPRGRGMELIFEPPVCNYKKVIEETDFGCGDGHVFPSSVRCVYDTDPAGFLIGCRSGKHLQRCDNTKCPTNTARCPGSFCIPLKFICDGEIQCPGGHDEKHCGCQSSELEVILVHADDIGKDQVHTIGKQFFSNISIVRELRYRERTSPKLDNEQTILDITDTEVDPFSLIKRQYVCNYTMLTSEFIKTIKFTKVGPRGLIYFESNVTNSLSKVFKHLETNPGFLIYRVRQNPTRTVLNNESLPFVRDITVDRWSTLETLGAKYFPDLCQEAANVYCPNQYKCSKSKTCIPLHQVCDGFVQCTHGDDERSCDYTCPGNCSCLEFSTDCSDSKNNESIVSSLDKKSRSIDLSRNPGLRNILVSTKWLFPYLILLNLSNCGIQEIAPNIFQSLVNLRTLDLSFNEFRRIPRNAFVGLHRLELLSIDGNKNVLHFDSYSLTGLKAMPSLKIKKAKIGIISAFTFAGLDLDIINVSDSSIVEMKDDVFSGLNVRVIDIERNEITGFDQNLFRGVSGLSSLLTPEFKFCCVKPNYLPEKDCFPKRDEFSSCDDLIRHPVLQIMLWFIGILALIGNVLSITYRIVYDRERLKFGYGIFVTNLAVADFFMGMYLIFIAIADAAFKERYIFEDAAWRSSMWCTIAGFLSTISSEASVFFLCLITLDRLFVIKFPFGQVRFDSKKATIACGVSWIISIMIGAIPIFDTSHFKNRFYSKSGVCIALPLTRDRPPGWLYSIIVFVGLNFVTFCLIAMGQIAIYFEIKKATTGIKHSRSSHGKKGAGRSKELTVARNLLLVVATDFLCWFPIGCMGIMSIMGQTIPGDVYAWTAVFVLPINSALNPVLYTLTAYLGKRKAQKRSSLLHSTTTNVPVRHIRPFNGIFRYFMNYSSPDCFISLDDLKKGVVPVGPTDAARIALNLTRCVCLLHKNSLVLQNLDGQMVYINVECGKILGDIQLRKEPVVCTDRTIMTEDIYQLGVIIRTILAKAGGQTAV